MPLQAREWVYDLSGTVKIPVYLGVYKCPKCGTEVSNEYGFRYNERKEKHIASKGRNYYITSFDAQTNGTKLTMDEYVEVTCGVCGYAWAEACIDYKSPEVFIALDELFGFLPVLTEHVDAAFAAEAAEAEAKARESLALVLSKTKCLIPQCTDPACQRLHDSVTTTGPSRWEQESAGSIQPFSMLSPEDQAQREVDALTPVLDTPEETVLPTKRERFALKVWHFVDPRVNVITAGLSMVGGTLGLIYLLAHL